MRVRTPPTSEGHNLQRDVACQHRGLDERVASQHPMRTRHLSEHAPAPAVDAPDAPLLHVPLQQFGVRHP